MPYSLVSRALWAQLALSTRNPIPSCWSLYINKDGLDVIHSFTMVSSTVAETCTSTLFLYFQTCFPLSHVLNTYVCRMHMSGLGSHCIRLSEFDCACLVTMAKKFVPWTGHCSSKTFLICLISESIEKVALSMHNLTCSCWTLSARVLWIPNIFWFQTDMMNDAETL